MHDVCYFLTMTFADSPIAQRLDLKSEKISIGMQASHLRAPVTLAILLSYPTEVITQHTGFWYLSHYSPSRRKYATCKIDKDETLYL